MITKQPVLNIGMVGHIDHGKTTLLQKLTGKWTDTHSEELKRGITIKLGYSEVTIYKCSKCGSYGRFEECKCGGKGNPARYVSFVDVPGHEMLMATMLSGAAIIDAALLVIAANEPCPRPQTKEHLVALQTKGINNIVILQNKVDAVTKEEALKNYDQIKEFIRGTIAENSPIIPVSAKQEVNLGEVFKAIIEFPVPERDLKNKPLFFIARSFDVNKPGAEISNLSGGVLGGTLKHGTLKVGDEIEIKPGMTSKKHDKTIYTALKTKVIGLQSGKNQLEEAIPSGSLAIQTSLDPSLTKADNLGGCVVSLVKGLPEPSEFLSLKVNLFKEMIGSDKNIGVAPIKVGEPLLISINTSITLGRVTKVKGDKVEMSLKIPVILIPESKVGIARNVGGHWRLIGWGDIPKA